MKCCQQCVLCLLGMWDRCNISCPSGTQHQEALHELTWKVVFLLAICTAKKVSDLLLFSVHSSLCHVGDTSIVLQAAFGSRRDHHLSHRVPPVKLKQCVEESLCPVRYLKEYIDKTKELRGDTTVHLSLQATPTSEDHHSRRWRVHMLRKAGIKGSADSTQPMATGCALLKDVPLQQIMILADWSCRDTLLRHYIRVLTEQTLRDVEQKQIQDALLV